MAALAVIVVVAGIYALIIKPQAPQPPPPTTAPSLQVLWESEPLVDKSWLIENGLYINAYSWMGWLKGCVEASPDGSLVAVATHKGEVYVFTCEGELVKKLSFELGQVPYCLKFTPDSKYLVVGLSSRRGELLVYDVEDWSLAWRYEVPDDLLGESNATEATITKNPWLGNAVNFVAFDESGTMYLVASSRYVDPNKQYCVYKKVTVDLMEIYPEIKELYPQLESYEVSLWTGMYFSRVLAVDLSTWQVKWRWPSQGVARIFVPMVSVDPRGRYLALCTWLGFDPCDPHTWHGGIVALLDAGTGKTLWRWSVPPRVPVFNRTSIYNGLGISDDAKYVVVEPSDGSVFAIDVEESIARGRAVVKWSASIMDPVETEVLLIPKKGGEPSTTTSYIYAGTYFAGVVGDKVVPYGSATYVTYWSPLYERKPLIQHPNQTKLFVLSLETGELLFVDKFNGKPIYGKVVPFAKSDSLLMGCIGNDWVSADASMAGVYAWDLEGPRFVARFLTLTPVKYGVPLDVAAAGDYVYVLVGPINLAHSETERANIVGEYRLLALKLVT
ncbi:MAG: hypothetical protein DRJ69_05550 [Thermoprotei archaeon]|nr:MAG: hypothetical protein DRJ69_05550 [Thermoprotei archaeon]